EWRDVVVAEDEIAGVATLSADMCVGAELEFAEHTGREEILHNGSLPELPDHSIIMYRADNKAASPAAVLADYLTEAFSAS
ncbi:MAG: hypothetical protein AAF404_08810, partial [Pseudomonadota bacterium]